jgi:lysophospholipase L1-like esterase
MPAGAASHSGRSSLESTSPSALDSHRPATVRLATLALAALLLYLLLVLALDAQIAQVTLTWPWIGAAFVIGTVGFARGLGRAERLSAGALLNVALLALALLAGLLVADLGTSAYLGLSAPATDLQTLARTDRHALIEEWYPRTYAPTSANFVVQKPDFTISGRHFGGYYVPGMLRSRTLADSVLDQRELTIHIDSRGFRERSALEGCPMYTLGDSFTFGWGITDGASWPDLLEAALGRCVYNLGVNGASPAQEEYLLADLLARDTSLAPRRVLWTIYEGNDLEDSYAETSPATRGEGALERATRGTVLEAVAQLWTNIREESLLYRLRSGQVQLLSPAARRAAAARTTVDGVRLATPLFHSSTFGYMLVDAGLLRNAAEPESYVLSHPHRRQLDRAFGRMRQLADARKFAVTVIIIPSAPRLYAGDFPFVPAPSSVPYFVNYLSRLSVANGFDVVNLLDRLAPVARTELLYFRDDDHLSPRGHAVVAGLLSAHLQALDSPTAH